MCIWKLLGAPGAAAIVGREGRYFSQDAHLLGQSAFVVGEDADCDFSVLQPCHSSSDGQGTFHRASNQLPASKAGRGLDNKVELRTMKCNLNPENVFF